MFWFIILITYFIFEISNYIKYRLIFNKFNNFRNKETVSIETINKYVDEIINDYKYHIDDLPLHLDDHYYTPQNHDNTTRNSLASMLTQLFYYPNHNTIGEVENQKIQTIINIYEDKLQKKFKNIDIEYHVPTHKYVKWSEDELLAWYKPLILLFLMKLVKLIFRLYLFYHGFQKLKTKLGITIWYIERPKQPCNLFIHASVAGLMIYPNFIKKLVKKNCSIILPEIPGICFENLFTEPLTIRQICDDIVSFVVDLNIKHINLLAHSFGCSFASYIVNNHKQTFLNNKICFDKTIMIEGGILIPRIMKIFWEVNQPFDVLWKNLTWTDMITVLFLHRDLYSQFFIKRCTKLTDNILLGISPYEYSGKVFMFMSQDDNKFITKSFVSYMKTKNIPFKYKIYPNRRHGIFIADDEMQNDVIELL